MLDPANRLAHSTVQSPGQIFLGAMLKSQPSPRTPRVFTPGQPFFAAHLADAGGNFAGSKCEAKPRSTPTPQTPYPGRSALAIQKLNAGATSRNTNNTTGAANE